MSLPEFESNGMLPEGIHLASLADVKARLVDEFPESSVRSDLFAGLSRYQVALSDLGLYVVQWINGSFADKTRMNPEDVDVANFCHAEQYNRLDSLSRARAGLLLDGSAQTKSDFKCHTFLLIKQATGHLHAGYYGPLLNHLREFFSQPREYSDSGKTEALNRGRKGIIQMQVGEPTISPLP